MNINIKNKPYKNVKINLHAKWMQQFQKHHDISEKIKESLPNSLISTLSGKSLKKGWWKKGSVCNNGKYKISDSYLELYIPINNQISTFPIVSREYKKGKRFKRYWFKPSLNINWSYKQPRHEVLSLKVNQGNCFVLPENTKIININLNDIIGSKKNWKKNHIYQKDDNVCFKGNVFKSKEKHTSLNIFEKKHWDQCVDFHTNRQAHLGGFFTTKRG